MQRAHKSATLVLSRCRLQFHAYLGWPHASETFIFMRELTGKKGEKVIAACLPYFYHRTQDMWCCNNSTAFSMITFVFINLEFLALRVLKYFGKTNA